MLPLPPPVCNAHYYHHASQTNGDSIIFYTPTNNASNAHYYWTFGDGTNSTQVYSWHLYNGSGTFYACLTVTDTTSAGICSDTWCDSIHVTAPPPPVCNAHFYHYSSQTNADSVHFYPPTNNATNAHYSWTFGDGTTSSHVDPWHLYSGTGTFYACLTVTDTTSAGICSDTWCDSIHVTAPPPPVCNAHFYHYSLASNPDSVHFYPLTSNAANAHYSWIFGDGTTSSQVAPWHFYGAQGTYNVCLTVTDSGATGVCSATWCDNIFAPQFSMVVINPNPMRTISTVSLNNISSPVTFGIYDISGRLIYQRDNLTGGSFTINEMTIHSGIYFYRLMDQNGVVAQGKLIVVR